MKLVVTGGCGFIGSNLVERLVHDGHAVTVIDDLSLGTPTNLEGLPVKLHKASSADLATLVQECDGVFHLGMPSSSPMYKAKPELVGDTITAAIKVFEYAKQQGCKVVYASSSSLYNGNPTPFREDMAIYPLDYYTECRYAIERLATVYHTLHSVPSIGLRFFSVYGPKEHHKGPYANILSQFRWTMQKGERPLIYGDGTQTRDFIHVSDVTDALTRAMHTTLNSGVVNVGTGVAHSFNAIVDYLNDALGITIKPVYKPNPITNYVHHTLADTTRAQTVLGFTAATKLSTSIACR